MTFLDRLFTYNYNLDEEDATRLSAGSSKWYTVEIHPPSISDDVPATVPRFIREIMEIQSTFFGLRNASPVAAFEIRRPQPDRMRLQFAVPTKRLERKIRLHLTEAIPRIGFDNGVTGLPVAKGDTVSGGLLTFGREDMFPLETDFDRPPTNNVVAPLHRDALRDTRIIIQLLFQPVAGHPLRRSLWTRRAYKRIGYLNKEKHAVVPWMDRSATKAERHQADTVEHKARNPRFHVAIRILMIGVDEKWVRTRLKEVGGGFNVFESPVTNQYLDLHTIKSLFPTRIIQFAESVAYRRMDGWTLPFQAGIDEVAGLLAVPTIDQQNLRRASP